MPVAAEPSSRSARRDRDGFLPIGQYAAIGDGRALALVATDGAIDWLALPALDSATVFAAVLDPDRGGSFTLCPREPFATARRYVPDTNVLETTFTTATGTVRVVDALTLPGREGLAPSRELARRVVGVSGTVPMRWRVDARFGYATAGRRVRGGGVPVVESGADALAVLSWEAGAPERAGDVVEGHFAVGQGQRSLVALSAARGEPLVFPARDEVERRLDATTGFWRRWAGALRYDGPWRDAVVRSALALKLLLYAPSGAIAAAGTTSLPERVGGHANWDYRFSWLRDASFTVDALLRLGCEDEAHGFFWWLMHASQLSHPHMRVLYTLDGGEQDGERELGLRGYRDSRPVRAGNRASE